MCDECRHPWKFHTKDGCPVLSWKSGVACNCTRRVDHSYKAQADETLFTGPITTDQNPPTEAAA